VLTQLRNEYLPDSLSIDSKYRMFRRLFRNAPTEMLDQVNVELNSLRTKPIVEHRDRRFTFNVPMGSIQVSKWKGLSYPPFYNRQRAIFSLLNDCYKNYTKSTPKPCHTILATSAGFGKTRLILEWAIRVFHLPDIVSSFLLGSQDINKAQFQLGDLTKKTKKERMQMFLQIGGRGDGDVDNETYLEGIERRLEFLAQLHKTMVQGRVINTSAALYNFDNAALICEKIMKQAIEQQLSIVTINNQYFDIDSTRVEDWIAAVNAGSRLTSLYEFYQEGVDQISYKPIFKDVAIYGVPITLINIDECQVSEYLDTIPFFYLFHPFS